MIEYHKKEQLINTKSKKQKKMHIHFKITRFTNNSYH